MFTAYKTIAFTGSRSLHPDRTALISDIATKARKAGTTVLVGCASGADEAVRRAAPQAHIVSVKEFLYIPTHKGRLAARSAALVQALVKQKDRAALIAFPGSPCPPGLKISRYPFKGHGSGTWATVALALSYHIPCFVFPPFVRDEATWEPMTPLRSLPAWWGDWQHIGWGSPFGNAIAGSFVLYDRIDGYLQAIAPVPSDAEDRQAWSFAAASGIPCF